jgi:hypothetical protein
MERFEKNVPGPFYTTGLCTACGAPEAEAPDLLAPLERATTSTLSSSSSRPRPKRLSVRVGQSSRVAPTLFVMAGLIRPSSVASAIGARTATTCYPNRRQRRTR